MDKDYCPATPSGKHLLAGNYANVITRSDFEPVSIGESAEDTLYRRVEYTTTTCQCGFSQKVKTYNKHDE